MCFYFILLDFSVNFSSTLILIQLTLLSPIIPFPPRLAFWFHHLISQIPNWLIWYSQHCCCCSCWSIDSETLFHLILKSSSSYQTGKYWNCGRFFETTISILNIWTCWWNFDALETWHSGTLGTAWRFLFEDYHGTDLELRADWKTLLSWSPWPWPHHCHHHYGHHRHHNCHHHGHHGHLRWYQRCHHHYHPQLHHVSYKKVVRLIRISFVENEDFWVL